MDELFALNVTKTLTHLEDGLQEHYTIKRTKNLLLNLNAKMLDFTKLVPAGRAKANGIPWSAEEQELLYSLIEERSVERPLAADYIRNGIDSLESYDKAVKAKFQPISISETHGFLNEALEKRGKVALKPRKRVAKKAVSKKKK